MLAVEVGGVFWVDDVKVCLVVENSQLKLAELGLRFG